MGAPRLQRPGTAHEFIADLLGAAGRREVEELTGATASTQSHWADPEEANGRRMPVTMAHRICRHSRAAAIRAARHFAGLAGGVFLPGPERDAADDLSAAGASLSRETAEASARLIEALGSGSLKPGDLTPDEARAVIREAQEVVEASGRLIAAARRRLPEGEVHSIRGDAA